MMGRLANESKMHFANIGITMDDHASSIRHAAAITAVGFLVVTALGYFLGFRQPDASYAWIAFYILISVPVQEIVFRGIIQTRLYRFGRKKAIAASSVLYSAIHFGNPLLVLLTLLAGIFWGYSFSRHPTLLGPSISHAILGTYLFLFIL